MRTIVTVFRPSLRAVLLSAILVAPGAALAQPAMPPATVSVVTLVPETLPVVNELPRRIVPTRVAEVRPRISGIIVERVFTRGSLVNEGEVLYRIDPPAFPRAGGERRGDAAAGQAGPAQRAPDRRPH